MKIVSEFCTFCEQEGLLLLPDDKKFIIDCLRNVPWHAHHDLLQNYADKFRSEDTPNKGRRAANLYLLSVI